MADDKPGLDKKKRVGTRNYLRAPFPYFGGKQKIAPMVWMALGDVRHYIEPFFGSGAVLLQRPRYDPSRHLETVADIDGHLCNVWRALRSSPRKVAEYCDWPVNQLDVAARRKVLIKREQSLTESLINDVDWYDAKLAGFWIWCTCCWIGGGLLTPTKDRSVAGNLVHLANNGRGVHSGMAMCKRPHIGTAGSGIVRPGANLEAWFNALAMRLRRVRVVCGDWSRVCGGDWQDKMGLVGIFFDPPYAASVGRHMGVYHKDSGDVSHAVEEWCLERGRRKSHRIVLAGYDGEHDRLVKDGWRRVLWRAQGGYASLGKGKTRAKSNRERERLYLSPYCLEPEPLLFEDDVRL